MTLSSRYIIGIDRGTTNCVVAYVDTQTPDVDHPSIQLFHLLQLVTPGNVEERDMLPSFLYLPGGHEFPAGSLTLQWAEDHPFIIGPLARMRGPGVPGG